MLEAIRAWLREPDAEPSTYRTLFAYYDVVDGEVAVTKEEDFDGEVAAACMRPLF